MRLPRSSAMFAAAALVTPRVVALVAPRAVSAAARAAPRAALPLVRALSAKVTELAHHVAASTSRPRAFHSSALFYCQLSLIKQQIHSVSVASSLPTGAALGSLGPKLQFDCSRCSLVEAVLFSFLALALYALPSRIP